MTIEDQFYNALDEWNKYRAKHKYDNLVKPSEKQKENIPPTFLNCDGYRTLITFGQNILPYIQNELEGGQQSRYNNETYREYKLNEIELKANEIYQRLFNTQNPNLNQQTKEGRKNNNILLDDTQYNQLLDQREIIEIGDPKILWCYLISAITPEFQNPAKNTYLPLPEYTTHTLNWLKRKLGNK